MIATQTAVEPSPLLLIENVNAYHRTAIIRAAIELDVFTAIGEGKRTASDLARRCEASERGMRILCDSLTAIGFLTKIGSAYDVTPDTMAFLDRRSPSYLGSIVKFLTAPEMMAAFQDPAAMVRKGGTLSRDGGAVAPENPMWVEFARSMGVASRPQAQRIAELVGADSGDKWRVLDIAAGHGTFGIAIAERNPKATIVAQDWPNVLEVARGNAEQAGIADRFDTIPGNALEVDFGGKYDLILIANLLHHFDILSCEALLFKVRAALAKGGRAVILGFQLNEDRVSPPLMAMLNMLLLGITPAGEHYTIPEYQRMCRDAGFSRTEAYTIPPLHVALIAHI